MSWQFEMAPVNRLKQAGWTRDLVRQGDRVTVKALPAKDNSARGHMVSMTLPNGNEFVNRDPWVDAMSTAQ